MATFDEEYQTTLQLHREGNFPVAAARYRALLQIDPRHAPSWHLLGLVLFQSGEAVTGAEHIRRAIELNGQNPVYYGNLGVIYRSLGYWIESVQVLTRALELDPNFVDAHVNLGNTLTTLCRAEEAATHYQLALARQPRHVAAHAGWAHALSELGDAEGAAREYSLANEIVPRSMFRVLAATQLPPIYQDHAELLAWRERVAANVETLVNEGVTVDLTTDGAMPIFSLAHQGLNDVELLRQVARLYQAPPAPNLAEKPAAAAGRIHVGFISSHFRDHTIGKLMRGFITHLDRSKFYVSVFSLGHHQDETALKIQQAADHYVPLGSEIPPARAALAQAGLDILFYTDIGMDQTTYSLAFSRLAPVQCVSWGHPDTTSLDTIDYFVSSELFESAGADAHYHERLVRLPSLPLYYYPPSVPAVLRTRRELGLDDGAHLYVCPQSIYKFHPDFDPVIAEILRRDPLGQLVLIQWIYPRPDEMLLERWRRVMPDVVDRVRFVRRLSQPDFMGLLSVSDVMLDPLRFGGGNTSAEALALGLPIVTLPDEFMRSRITAAFFRQMGLDELIASSPAEYIERAVRLGTDASYHAAIKQQILGSLDRLYEDTQAVRSLEAFFERAHREATASR